jgi:co-chaperonin GroES (HSP10)
MLTEEEKMPSTTATFEKRAKAAQQEAKTKQQMTEWVQKVYADTERYIQPLKPFILVRTLPRSTITAGGILMPEKQNKPNIESVVLAVYEPYWENVYEQVSDKDISVYNECDIKVGDHIVMPHFVGMPDTFLDEREYRLIKEDDAIAVLHYREKGEFRKMVRDIMVEAYSLSSGAMPADVMLGALFDKFDIVPKTVYSRTTSGK